MLTSMQRTVCGQCDFSDMRVASEATHLVDSACSMIRASQVAQHK